MTPAADTAFVYGFFGAGQMGEAIFKGLLDRGLADPGRILICEADPGRASLMRQRHSVTVLTDPDQLIRQSDVVVLAVKPQELENLLDGLTPDSLSRPLFISIAAGKTLAWLESKLPGARVVRCMPNLAMRVGAGMSAYCLGQHCLPTDRQPTADLLSSAGLAREVDESLFDAVTALSGSGPAFFAVILQAFVSGAVTLGMSQDEALAFARQTFAGTAAVLSDDATTPDEFARAVTSAGGTTAAGLAVLQSSAMVGIIADTLAAAARRSRELGQ